MNVIKISFLLIFSVSMFALGSIELDESSNTLDCGKNANVNASGTCFKKSERVSGMNKICTYSCVSGDKAITIGSTSLCPLSIKG